ncbi:RluA family pseudouridine synthase [Streptomyces spiramenti]|uniref:RNA pseudouridylate synthase n=1 Tax=Streptomyces spiramenti TaxID=2720606 RepID=A0ABX1AU55_9ACTN|nr:RNA pseudouridine synthase [Streptomyces spiramenti]NJP67937.1 RNA pseudouridine synthase [Streptomyces spiramenti]
MATRHNGAPDGSATGGGPETDDGAGSSPGATPATGSAVGPTTGSTATSGPTTALDWPTIRRRTAVREDDAVLVIDKPADVSVVGERHDTDLMQLAKDADEWLMPAHRIDKVTSGVVLLARSLPVHADLARQFNRRSVGKAYLAVVRNDGLPGTGPSLPEEGEVDLPLSVGRKSRVRVAAPREAIRGGGGRWYVEEGDVLPKVRNYPSKTLFATVWRDERHSVLVVRPVTGRRHQIRVHLAWIGHPIEGDPLFARAAAPPSARASLHSWQLAYDQEWSDGSRVTVSAAPDEAFWSPVRDRLQNGVDGALDRAKLLLGRLERQARTAR